MPLNNDIFKAYAELESDVRGLMVRLFSETCGMCTACCCRADICEEATESAFLLKLLHMQGLNPDAMDERFGWLDLHGCSLEYGRPPVCYSYYCDELLERLPDDETRYVARKLGNLIFHVGYKALGSWHLVEVMEESDLDKIDAEALFQRLEEARAAFGIIEQYVEVGSLNLSDREILSVITTEEP